MRIPKNLKDHALSINHSWSRSGRIRALEIYYKQPRKCLYCKKIIHAKPAYPITETRKQKFCSH